MTDYDIGLLGGYGAVGIETARLLLDRDPGLRMLIAGRDGQRATDLAAKLGGRCDGVAVDIDGPDLADFCARSRVVVNCAGPSYRVLDKVARAALTAGVHYVDPGGDDPVYNRLAGVHTGGLSVVLNAGMMPGLTALLPRWLFGQEQGRPTKLTAYIGTMDRLTPAGAADYLLSMGGGHGDSGAAVRGGAVVQRVLTPLSDVELPYFSGLVSAYPYLSRESERTVRSLGIPEVDWYNVFDGGAHMMKALGRLQGVMAGHGDLQAGATELTEAAALDLFGRDPYQLMVIQARTTDQARTVVLRGRDTYQLTGFLAAFSAEEILADRMRPGVVFAADVLDPEEVVRRLRELPAVTGFSVLDAEQDDDELYEDGVL